MSEQKLNDVLMESYRDEFEEFDNVPEHKFSLKHGLAMKRIFKLYEKNTECYRKETMQNTPAKPKVKFTRKTALVLVMIIFLGAFLGCTAVYYISHNFYGEVHKEYTRIHPIYTENCPTRIEEEYYLPDIPEGFVLLEEDSSPFSSFTLYMNEATNQTIVFNQIVKSAFGTVHLNTEHHDLEEIKINGNYGILLDFSDDTQNSGLVMWDNGDYILEVSADMNKNDVINLAESAKILKSSEN